MFLPKDPVAARDVLCNTCDEKLREWLMLLNLLINSDTIALEVQCLMDDVPTFEELRDAARSSIERIETHRRLNGPGDGSSRPLMVTPAH